jgi:diacylglycerol kinase family enzyme
MEGDASAMGGFLLINPRSGQGSNAGMLRDEASRLGIETHLLRPDENPSEVARLAPHGPLGMAGGDGSLSAIADVAIDRGVPFVVVPFGTSTISHATSSSTAAITPRCCRRSPGASRPSTSHA